MRGKNPKTRTKRVFGFNWVGIVSDAPVVDAELREVAEPVLIGAAELALIAAVAVELAGTRVGEWA
jgi:hypothetical protein